MRSAGVEIGISDEVFGQQDSKERIYLTILHEIGHALGLDHSRSPLDAMSGHGRHPSVTGLSMNDICALLWNYSMPPGLNLPDMAAEIGAPVADSLYDLLVPLDKWYLGMLEGGPQVSGLAFQGDAARLQSEQDFLAQHGKFQIVASKPKAV